MAKREVDEGYNGWKNYETWNVALWIGNEPDTYERSRELTAEAWEESAGLSANARLTGHEPFTRDEKARFALARSLKSWVEDELVPDLGASMASDLLGAALSEVDWDEIAANYLSDYEKPEEDEEGDDDSDGAR